MSNVITTAVQPSRGRIAQVGRYAWVAWTLANAVVAVIAGITTLNMVVANLGVATLHEAASPFMQQLAFLRRQV